jgi:hypothetical protein
LVRGSFCGGTMSQMKLDHPTYRQMLASVPEMEKYFMVAWLDVSGEKFKLVKFTKTVSAKAPLMVIMAGCHGEEPAPPLAFFKEYKRIAKAADQHGVNLVVYPLVNPWGFDRNERFNRERISCNSNWIHSDHTGTAKEVQVIQNDIKKYRPTIFISQHEDSETGGGFYFYSFGNRKYEKVLLQVGKKHFSVLKDGSFGDLKVKSGTVYDLHDSSAEDFMSHRGRSAFTCCTETPLLKSLQKRMRCNTDWLVQLIQAI